MWLNNYEWHLDYIRLARESSFSFEKSKCPLDKNKICLLDVDTIVEEKDVGIIEHFLPSIIQYNIDSHEHVGILDQNFLKLFRMSQLAVEYLLFCKKYLDHTVILLKEEIKDVKLENNELTTFNNELKQHTDTLLAKLKNKEELITTFKCEKCLKAFSTEQYLSAHITRRHGYKNVESFGLDIEMEIKQIKEKLNNTEKLIKNEELNPRLEDTLNKNYTKVSELLLKFDSLRSQVENDFKMLHTQNDLGEKYSKILQSALDNMKIQINRELGIQNSPYKFHEKRTSITQTESDAISTSEKNVQVEDVQEQTRHISNEKFEEQKLQKLEDQMKNTCESISLTMGSSLKNIETQMHALWEKLHEIELKKSTTDKKLNQDKTSGEIAGNESNKPKPKLRKRFSSKLQNTVIKASESSSLFQEKELEEIKVVRPSSDTRYDTLDDNEKESKINVADSKKSPSVESSKSKTRYDDLDRIDVLEDVEQSKTITLVKSVHSLYETEDLESEEEDSELTPEIMSESDLSAEGDINNELSSKHPDIIHKKQSGSTLGGRSISSLRRVSVSSEVVERLKKEMEKVLAERLSVLGVSNDWKGIPKQTYTRVMDILNHQARLVQKTTPDYKNIRKEILSNLEDEIARQRPLEKISNQKKLKKTKVKSISSSRSWNIANRSSLRMKRHQSVPEVEIRNRKMYESDSTSEEENKNTNLRKTASTIVHQTPHYSAVIQELKQTQKSEENLRIQTKDSPKNVLPVNDLERMDQQMKSVLKNFPAPGPVPKKRVLFDLKSQDSEIQRPVTRDAGGGSTTSVASSVLDLSDVSSSKEEDKEKAEVKMDLEDFSDSDFSILEDKEGKSGEGGKK